MKRSNGISLIYIRHRFRRNTDWQTCRTWSLSVHLPVLLSTWHWQSGAGAFIKRRGCDSGRYPCRMPRWCAIVSVWVRSGSKQPDLRRGNRWIWIGRNCLNLIPSGGNIIPSECNSYFLPKGIFFQRKDIRNSDEKLKDYDGNKWTIKKFVELR